MSRVRRVGAALTPDFSLWPEMPLVMQLWQVYRSRWCGAWMLQHGIQVVPTISWSTTETFPFAFAGVPLESVVAISTVGARGQQARRRFDAGLTAMMDHLQPAALLVYGKPPARSITGSVPVHCYPTRWAR